MPHPRAPRSSAVRDLPNVGAVGANGVGRWWAGALIGPMLGLLAACSGEDSKPPAADGGSGAGGMGGAGQSGATGGAAGGMPGGCPGANEATTKTLRIYVAGESIEERNRFIAAPFRCDGTLDPRGGGDAENDNDEYGWMVPMAA